MPFKDLARLLGAPTDPPPAWLHDLRLNLSLYALPLAAVGVLLLVQGRRPNSWTAATAFLVGFILLVLLVAWVWMEFD